MAGRNRTHSDTPAAPVESPPETAAPSDTPAPVESLKSEAISFLGAMVRMREVVGRIHAMQVDGVDGTAAAGEFVGALLAMGAGLPGFPPDPWSLKQLLDARKYPAEDPQQNASTKALVAYLFDCLEEGRLRPGRDDARLARIAERWPTFATRADAVHDEDEHHRVTHRDREYAAAQDHHSRLARPAPGAARRAPPADPVEVPEPPDMTVG